MTAAAGDTQLENYTNSYLSQRLFQMKGLNQDNSQLTWTSTNASGANYVSAAAVNG